MCVAARDTERITVTTYPLRHRHYTELPLFSRGHGFLHFRRGQRRRENVAKTSRIRLCRNGIPPRGKQPPAFVRAQTVRSASLVLPPPPPPSPFTHAFPPSFSSYASVRSFANRGSFSSLSRDDHRLCSFVISLFFALVVERVIRSDVCPLIKGRNKSEIILFPI